MKFSSTLECPQRGGNRKKKITKPRKEEMQATIYAPSMILPERTLVDFLQ